MVFLKNGISPSRKSLALLWEPFPLLVTQTSYPRSHIIRSVLASPLGKCLEQTRIPNYLEFIGRRHLDPGLGCCHLWYMYPGISLLSILNRVLTSPNFHSSHTVFNVQVSNLSLWSLKLCKRILRYVCISTCHLLILPFTAMILNTEAEQQLDDVTPIEIL